MRPDDSLDRKFEVGSFFDEGMPDKRAKRTRKQWLRDFAVYTAISLGLLSIPVLIVVFDWHLDWALAGLGCAFLFAFAMAVSIEDKWYLLRLRRTWAILCLVLPMHVLSFYAIYRYGHSRVYYTLLGVIEVAMATGLFAGQPATKA